MTIDINQLTIGQAKELVAMLGGSAPQQEGFTTPHIGKVCIIRCHASGVFCGTVAKHSGRMVELEGVRRLWGFVSNDGIELLSVARHGVNSSDSRCRITCTADAVTVLDVLEIIPCTDFAEQTIFDASPVRGKE